MAATSKSVLIVDSNPHVNHHLKRLLEGHGYIAEQAYTAKEAFGKLNSQFPPFDLLIFDVQLPDMDGISAILRIRDMLVYAHTSIMILTADSKSTTVSRAIAAGVIEYMTKPFDENDLLFRINRLVGGVLENPLDALDDTLRKEINRAQRAGTRFSLIVMKSTSPATNFPDQEKTLRSRLRDIDQILLFSDSLVIVLPLTDIRGVRVVSSKIMSGQDKNKWLCGGSTFPEDGSTPEALYHKALLEATSQAQ